MTSGGNHFNGITNNQLYQICLDSIGLKAKKIVSRHAKRDHRQVLPLKYAMPNITSSALIAPISFFPSPHSPFMVGEEIFTSPSECRQTHFRTIKCLKKFPFSSDFATLTRECMNTLCMKE